MLPDFTYLLFYLKRLFLGCMQRTTSWIFVSVAERV